jgi:hypothetical protein
MASTTGSRG